jgi:WD40 repeat protein
MFRLLVFLVCVLGWSDLTQPRTHTRMSYFHFPPIAAAAPAAEIRRLAVLADATGTDKSLLRISPDGELLATGTGSGPVRLWDTRSGKLVADLHGTEGQAPQAFSPVGDRLLASNTLKSVSLYDLNAVKLRWYVKLEKLLGSINFFETFSPNGELFIVDSVGKGRVTVWETKTARMLAFRRCSNPLFHSTFSPDSKSVLTSCGDRKAMLWDAQTGNIIAEFSNPEDVLVAVFGPDSKSVTTITITGHVINWDATTGRMKNSWQGRDAQIYFAAFSPDGDVLATVCWNGTAILWDVEKQKQKYELRVSRSATHVNFSPDSRFLTANGHRGEVAVWNVADGSRVLSITDHRKDLDSAVFSIDSRFLTSSSADAVNIWDLTGKVHVAKLDATLLGLFSKDGKLLVTGGQKNTVTVWEVVP